MKAVIHAEWDTDTGRLDYSLHGSLADLIYLFERGKYDLISGNLRPAAGTVGRPPADVSSKAPTGNQPAKFSARTIA